MSTRTAKPIAERLSSTSRVRNRRPSSAQPSHPGRHEDIVDNPAPYAGLASACACHVRALVSVDDEPDAVRRDVVTCPSTVGWSKEPPGGESVLRATLPFPAARTRPREQSDTRTSGLRSACRERGGGRGGEKRGGAHVIQWGRGGERDNQSGLKGPRSTQDDRERADPAIATPGDASLASNTPRFGGPTEMC